MRKLAIILAILCLLTGCSHPASPANTGDFITPTAKITQLEPGLSTVRHEGDYGFDLFLEQGGADSDGAVVQFLMENLLGDTGLQFAGGFFGCSTISVANPDGGYYFGRNFDWQACDALIVASYPENGYASIATVNLDFIKQGVGSTIAKLLPDEILTVAALYAPLDGMNERGLCVSVNMIQDGATIHQNTGKPDITTTTAIRLMLDKAANVEEAIALLEQYDLHASMEYMIHFAIADSDGNSVAVEYVNNEMIVIETPILTNYYLAEGEKQGIGTQQSHERFELLTETLQENPAMSADQVRDALDSVSKDNFGGFDSTEWSIVFDQSALTATYYHRENYETGYAFKL